MALDVHRIRGQPIEVVQRVMADYSVTVYVPGHEDEVARGWVRDLDLSSFHPDALTFYPGLGGCSVGLRDGVVSGVGFCYD